MPKISEARRAERREQILDAALGCFAERGFKATSMADIIAVSGLSAGAIYLYFKGKWEIARAVAQRVAGAPLAEALGAAATGAPLSPAEMIRSLGAGLDRNGIPPGIIVQIWGEAATDPDFSDIPAEVFEMINRESTELLASWYAAGDGGSRSQALARAKEMIPVMLSVTQGYILQRALLADFDEERYLAAVERTFGR